MKAKKFVEWFRGLSRVGKIGVIGSIASVVSVVLPLGEAVDIGQRPASLAIDHGETERCPLVHTRDRQDLTILRVDSGGTEQRSKQRDGERGQTGHQRHISSR